MGWAEQVGVQCRYCRCNFDYEFSCGKMVDVAFGHSRFPLPFSKVNVYAQDNDGKCCLHWSVETATAEAIICIKLLCKRFPGMACGVGTPVCA